MKAGQLLAYVDDYIPEPHRLTYTGTLGKLLVKAEPLPWESVERVIVEDLGSPPDRLFETFDREPIAAASIGQVYRATLRGGEEVAVKVQYPGIADSIRADLRNIDLLRSALSLLLPKVDVERSLEDVTSRVLEECDYGCEACNQEEFKNAWGGDPSVLVPRVYPELSGDRVLVSELVRGHSWNGRIASANAEERSRLGKVIFRFVFRSLYLFGLLNADPHPGNYVFLEDGRVAFLDFGCVQRFDPQATRAFRELDLAIRRGVRGGPLLDFARAAYGLADDLDDEEWEFLEEYLLACFAPVLSPRFRFDRRYTEGFRDLTLRGSRIGTRKMIKKGLREAKRTGLVLLNRITYGLFSILAALETEASFADMTDEIFAECDARGAK
jgi:hypothetical protein